jgi:hypothetical protein
VRPRQFRPEYTAPAKDSARAIAQATLCLCGARSIDGVTIDHLARQYRLSPKRAEYMLMIEQRRRGE